MARRSLFTALLEPIHFLVFLTILGLTTEKWTQNGTAALERLAKRTCVQKKRVLGTMICAGAAKFAAASDAAAAAAKTFPRTRWRRSCSPRIPGQMCSRNSSSSSSVQFSIIARWGRPIIWPVSVCLAGAQGQAAQPLLAAAPIKMLLLISLLMQILLLHHFHEPKVDDRQINLYETEHDVNMRIRPSVVWIR